MFEAKMNLLYIIKIHITSSKMTMMMMMMKRCLSRWRRSGQREASGHRPDSKAKYFVLSFIFCVYFVYLIVYDMCICIYSVYSGRVREKHRGIRWLPKAKYFVLSSMYCVYFYIFVYILCVYVYILYILIGSERSVGASAGHQS